MKFHIWDFYGNLTIQHGFLNRKTRIIYTKSRASVLRYTYITCLAGVSLVLLAQRFVIYSHVTISRVQWPHKQQMGLITQQNVEAVSALLYMFMGRYLSYIRQWLIVVICAGMLALCSFVFSLILEISLSAMHCVTSSETAASVIYKNRMCTMRGVVFEGGASLAQPLAPNLAHVKNCPTFTELCRN